MRIIGITGLIAAGKDTAANYLSEKLHSPIIEISARVKEMAKERGITGDRQKLIALGTEVAKEYGEEYLARHALIQLPQGGIITGIRQIKQIEYLDVHSDFTLLCIQAHPETRFHRANGRGKAGKATNLQEFLELEHAENSPPNVQRVFDCMKLSDYHIVNNGTFAEFYQRLDKIQF